ncbi:MAG: hypothetical protein GW949_02080 [Spirochaetales bacterium]|nr:hypothetical protein [Spirochaetales bacterium]
MKSLESVEKVVSYFRGVLDRGEEPSTDLRTTHPGATGIPGGHESS